MEFELFDEYGQPLPQGEILRRTALPRATAKAKQGTGAVTNVVSAPPPEPSPEGFAGPLEGAIAPAVGLPQATGRQPAGGAVPAFGTPGYLPYAYEQEAAARKKAFELLTPSEEDIQRGRDEAQSGVRAGLAMQLVGGKDFQDIGGKVLTQALAQQSKYDADPWKKAALESKRLEAEAAAWDNRAKLAVTHAEKAAALEEARLRREEGNQLKLMIAGMAGGARSDRAAEAKSNQLFARTDKLAKEYNAVTKDVTDTLFAAKKVAEMTPNALAKMTAQDQMGMIFNFMKALDPGSVVRESEYAAAAKARGLMDTIRNYPEYLRTGKPLTPTQVANMVNVAKNMTSLMQELQNEHNAHYEQRAQRWGVDPVDIVRGGTPKATAAPGPGSPGRTVDVGAKLKPKPAGAAKPSGPIEVEY